MTCSSITINQAVTCGAMSMETNASESQATVGLDYGDNENYKGRRGVGSPAYTRVFTEENDTLRPFNAVQVMV